jgi:integral membrane protein (TIGR01906 family)
MKYFKTVTRILFILAIPAFIFSLNLAIAINSQWLYEAGFAKYDISQVTGISDPELSKAANGLISYFNNSDEYINIRLIRNGQPYQLFSEDEIQILHMKDVKNLFHLDYKVLLGSLLFIIVYLAIMFWRKNFKNLAWDLISGSSLTLALMAFLGIAVFTGFFDSVYFAFHRLAFTNDFWLLDPNVDVLIMLVPDGFQQDVASFIALLTGIEAAIIGAIGGWYVWKKKSNEAIST